jgi:hypothetical protein
VHKPICPDVVAIDFLTQKDIEVPLGFTRACFVSLLSTKLRVLSS